MSHPKNSIRNKNIGPDQESDPAVPDVRDALSRVLSSEEFASANRMQEFLTWVVDEWIAGRAAAISGKSIAAAVYERDITDDESGLNLVRVEARRLRRRLERYYNGPGRGDPWKIRIDKGGYAPRFESIESLSVDTRPVVSSRRKNRLRTIIATATIGAVVVALIFLIEKQVPLVEESGSRVAAAERAAIGSRSMVSLQAVNLATQARNLLFPAFDIRQQQLALETFRHVINLDPGLHHGYAGAAQVLGVLGLLEADEQKASLYLDEASEMAAAAVERSPTDPWAVAAKGWVMAVNGSVREGIKHARLAVEIAPDDGHVLDLAGITAIVTGDGAFAAEVSDPASPRSGNARFAANNIWGVSQYMVGNYAETIQAFSGAAEAGASVSAPSLVFLAIASDHAGDTDRAAEAVRELQKSWPAFPLEFVVGRMFQNAPAYANDILDRIGKYGYHARP